MPLEVGIAGYLNPICYNKLAYRDSVTTTVTDISSSFEEEELSVYPVPFSKELSIEQNENTGKINYEIVNTDGHLIASGQVSGKVTIPTNQFEEGIYILKLTKGNTVAHHKIIKY